MTHTRSRTSIQNTLGVRATENITGEVRRLNNTQFRVLGRADRLNPDGRPCSRFLLGNLTVTCKAVVYHNQITPLQRTLQYGDVVEVDGELLLTKNNTMIRIDQLRKPITSALKPTALLPREWVLPAFAPQLNIVLRHWESVIDRDLQEFLAMIFSDASNALGFLTVHGSLRHHHAYQGGLLDHTADMLTSFRGTHPLPISDLERDIATVLIMLHDIGKTVTLVGNGRGAYQPHDMAALEILALPLTQLESKSPVLANVIRAFFKPKNWQPQFHHRAYNIVSALDRQSATDTAVKIPFAGNKE